ncbi:tRNA-dihydrouridine synthase [Candidatus Saccharibacteria bacterium]|nr:tRNA-dihydrouridine synthase [Candidatus Saccharibacteria bacterium]
MNIWSELKTPIIALAPMEGVTDIVFRAVVAKASRPDLFFTEFTNVSSFASEKGRHDALSRLEISASDSPIIAQIWGKNPDHFSEICSALKISGFSGIDLNFGCPDRHVNKAGGGAAMIRTPDLAVECFRRAKEAADGLPVSIKTRLGFTYPDEYKTWLPTLLNEHPAALTVHLRTRKEMSKVPAHFELIPELLRLRAELSPETKLLINGDIKSRSSALELSEKYPDLDGFMIGRGVFENPFCFKKTPDGSPYEPSREELFELFRYHLDVFDKYHNNPDGTSVSPKHFEPLKRFFKIYVKDFEGSKDLRGKLMLSKTTSEVRKILDDYS